MFDAVALRLNSYLNFEKVVDDFTAEKAVENVMRFGLV